MACSEKCFCLANGTRYDWVQERSCGLWLYMDRIWSEANEGIYMCGQEDYWDKAQLGAGREPQLVALWTESGGESMKEYGLVAEAKDYADNNGAQRSGAPSLYGWCNHV